MIQGRSRTGIVEIPCGGGIVQDELPQEVTEPIWTDGLNVRFRNGYVRKTEGYEQTLTAPGAAALHFTGSRRAAQRLSPTRGG